MTGGGEPASMPELPKITGELLDALECRYADPRVCRVCGALLQVTAVGGRDGVKMACTSDAASPMKRRYEAAGVTWKQALDHWRESTEYNPPDGDVRVLAVVAEVRRLRARVGPGIPGELVTAEDDAYAQEDRDG